jgi:hypothetical protein
MIGLITRIVVSTVVVGVKAHKYHTSGPRDVSVGGELCKVLAIIAVGGWGLWWLAQ